MSDTNVSETETVATPDTVEQPGNERQPEKGSFPFRIMESSTESVFLTWLRNHSSYLAAGGFVGTLAAIGVYLRGVFANLLMLSVIFIPLGAILGYLHYNLLAHPFLLSGLALVFGIVSMLTFFAARRGDPRDQVLIGSRVLHGLPAHVPGLSQTQSGHEPAVRVL